VTSGKKAVLWQLSRRLSCRKLSLTRPAAGAAAACSAGSTASSGTSYLWYWISFGGMPDMMKKAMNGCTSLTLFSKLSFLIAGLEEVKPFTAFKQ
jgi:hypothetical protein